MSKKREFHCLIISIVLAKLIIVPFLDSKSLFNLFHIVGSSPPPFFLTITVCQNISGSEADMYKQNKGFDSAEIHVGSDRCLVVQEAVNVLWGFLRVLTAVMTQQLSVWTCSVESEQRTNLASLPAAPPDYSSVVTEEEAEQCNNAVVLQPAEDLSGILERPLRAFVQEFRFRPPPVYSEVSHQMLEKTPTYSHCLFSLIGTDRGLEIDFILSR